MAIFGRLSDFGENEILENEHSPAGMGNSKNLIFQNSTKEDKNMRFSEVSQGGSDKLLRSKFFPVICINLLLEYDVNPVGFGEYEKVKLETNGEN